jgi:branched-chain amino acid transport system ATP-binding protein
MSSKPLLEIQNLSLQFGGITALSGVNLVIQPDVFHGLIGPNGAGKTSLINCISGALQPTAGSMRFKETALSGLAAHEISALGMSRSFQHVQLFGERSVRDHVLVGMHKRLSMSLWSQFTGWPPARRKEREVRGLAEDLMRRFDLMSVADQPAHVLPYGMLKRMDLARALVSQPALLLLDEPTSGMSEMEALQAIDIVKSISRSQGIGLIVIEHNMRVMMDLADQITMLHLGQVIAHGSPLEVVNNPVAIEAYLGEELQDA